ncbi:MAG: hypothetical protein QM820_21555 [Minicystis sp.]
MICATRKACVSVLFEGIGDGLRARVAAKIEKLSAQKVAEYFLADGQPHEPAWRDIGRFAFSWGCAYPRTRT